VASSRSRAVGVPPRDHAADPAEPLVPVGVDVLYHEAFLLARAAREGVPLGDDDDREVAAVVVAPPDVVARVLDRRRLLRHEDDVGAARDPARRRDPAGVATHDLDHHDAVVRLGGRVQPIDRLSTDVDGGVEADRHVGAGEIVVDRLGHAHDREAVLCVETLGDAERALSADRDDPSEPEAVAPPEQHLDAALLPEGVEPRAAEDGAPAWEDAGDGTARQGQE
jgi:hypothetical protein